MQMCHYESQQEAQANNTTNAIKRQGSTPTEGQRSKISQNYRAWPLLPPGRNTQKPPAPFLRMNFYGVTRSIKSILHTMTNDGICLLILRLTLKRFRYQT